MVEPAEDTVQCLTTKEIKALARPEFDANPEKFYPTETFKKMGYHRARCDICKNAYWRSTEERKTCGDSNCDGKYSFIGNGLSPDKKWTFADSWKSFEDAFTSARVPCTSIKRYPVVARWRNDVDYVAAGIYCFQPYCVTGELDPPANPLVCPQFCLRFNDLDNIGVTGRHYSGFIMMGNQVFNYPGDYKYFKEECLEFHHRWLTEYLKIPKEEITYIEDVWGGGGNLGPSIEFFVRGLEVGNMVFMQYKTFHDGSREELDIKIIDTGQGLERIAWLMNGTATSYMDTFAAALEFTNAILGVDMHQEIWDKFGPYSCTLNIDETEDVEQTWKELAEKIDLPVDTVKGAITEVKDLYIILDHTRTILIAISDGSLPSNVGGGGNVRNILRRVFMILTKHDWWKKLGQVKNEIPENFLQIFHSHKKDLEGIFGEFPEYKSFDQIIKVEYERWQHTDDVQAINLKKLVAKKKGKLSLDDWIVSMQSWGIPADKIAEISKMPIPGNLYYEIATRAERTAKAPEVILYNTVHIPETKMMFYDDGKLEIFDATVLEVFANIKQNMQRNLVILDQSAFYPTSGGQQHDTGSLDINGAHFEVVDVIKVGKCVLHVLDRPVDQPNMDEEIKQSDIKGVKVRGRINMERRKQLLAHHTGTHLVFASCRKVLGPHVWQAGAKKTTEKAHLDITHYKSLTKEEEMQIENQANRLINECHDISKKFMDKAEAEQQYGFSLYQGGVVPGNSLRVVDIAGVDTEACCGTHADNTAEVGWIRLIRSSRISDGIVRLEYCAQERAIELLNKENLILNSLIEEWGVDQSQITQTASRFFNEYKRLKTETKEKDQTILSLQIKYLVSLKEGTCCFVKSDQDNPTLFISQMKQYADQLQNGSKGIIFIGKSFIVGLIGKPEGFKVDDIIGLAKKISKKEPKVTKLDKLTYKFPDKKKKPISVKDVLQFMITGQDYDLNVIAELLESMGFTEMND